MSGSEQEKGYALDPSEEVYLRSGVAVIREDSDEPIGESDFMLTDGDDRLVLGQDEIRLLAQLAGIEVVEA